MFAPYDYWKSRQPRRSLNPLYAVQGQDGGRTHPMKTVRPSSAIRHRDTFKFKMLQKKLVQAGVNLFKPLQAENSSKGWIMMHRTVRKRRRVLLVSFPALWGGGSQDQYDGGNGMGKDLRWRYFERDRTGHDVRTGLVQELDRSRPLCVGLAVPGGGPVLAKQEWEPCSSMPKPELATKVKEGRSYKEEEA
ncbi:hypothetical protein K439DRAFT_1620596 [Ramaria rubella]|nr:hypothetical protein K439DRAFT_1620596 [Ramaria rubella]